MRDVHPLTDQQGDLLANTMTRDASPRARARAPSLLRSAQGMTINAITKISPVDRDTVSSWIRKWAHDGPASLHDQPRSGSPPTLTPEEQQLAIASIKEAPRSLKQVVARCSNKTDKRLSISSLKRLATRARLRWKRVRKSFKSLRDPAACARGKRALEALQQQEDAGKIALESFDEAGFALDPSMPYAWQESGTVIELPAMK